MSNPNKSLTNKRHSSQKRLLINSKDKFEKKFLAGSDVVFNSLKDLVQQQQGSGKKYSNNVLGIQSIIEDSNSKTITVTYDCDKSAIPLSKITYSSPKHKIQIFKHLYLIYGFLNKENILHRNLKPNNIILYNQQLLLTDFGYKQGDWIIDHINFLEVKSDNHNDNMYPYLSPEIADIIVSTNSFGHKRDSLKSRHQLSVKKQDQFAIAIMILEVFIPLKYRKTTNIKERKDQINDMNLSDDFSNEDEKFIKETILDLLYYTDFNENNFQNRLKKINEIEQQTENYKINKQELMVQEYQDQVKEILQNIDTQFNLNLLYHFKKDDLSYMYIVNNEENKKLKEEITRLLHLYAYVDELSFNLINELKNEDLFISLVYLDEQIENLQNSQNQQSHLIMSVKEQQYRNLKKSLKNQYQKLNNFNKDQFTFNKIGEEDDELQIIQFGEDAFQKGNEAPQTNREEQVKENINSVENNPPLNRGEILNDNGIDQQNEQQPNVIDQQIVQQPNVIDQQIVQQPNVASQQDGQQQNLNRTDQQNEQEILIPIYKIDSQTNQQNLLEAVKSTFQKPTLQIYFEINKCVCQKQIIGSIYKHKDNPNVICLGKIENNVFEGEVMQLEEKEINNNNKIKTIYHYVFVQIILGSWNIKDKEKKSSIFQYLEINSPQKFKKCKEYQGQIENGKKHGQGTEKAFIENMIYIGKWKDGYMFTEGTQKLIDTVQLIQNSPYKWVGSFEKGKLHGEKIKTYLLNYNNREVWLEGRYEDGSKKGVHTCYTNMINNKKVQPVKLYSAIFFEISNQEHEFKLTCN